MELSVPLEAEINLKKDNLRAEVRDFIEKSTRDGKQGSNMDDEFQKGLKKINKRDIASCSLLASPTYI